MQSVLSMQCKAGGRRAARMKRKLYSNQTMWFGLGVSFWSAARQFSADSKQPSGTLPKSVSCALHNNAVHEPVHNTE